MPMLASKNWSAWRRGLRSQALMKDVWRYILAGVEHPTGTGAALEKRTEAKEKALGIIVGGVDINNTQQLETLTVAFEAFKKEHVGSSARARFGSILQLVGLKLADDEDVRSAAGLMKRLGSGITKTCTPVLTAYKLIEKIQVMTAARRLSSNPQFTNIRSTLRLEENLQFKDVEALLTHYKRDRQITRE